MNMMLKKAYSIVQEAFKGKLDKAGAPYEDHCARVAKSLLADGYSYEVATIGMLHDLLEDCKPEWDVVKLSQEIPVTRIIAGVCILTRDENEDYPTYLDRILKSRDATLVKLADLKDNMNLLRFKRELTPLDLQRAKKYHSAYLKLLSDALPTIKS